MMAGKNRVQRKVEELVASTLEAKAAAPCKALKRRVCQRARKKLAHMLPQEEFEKVVARLKGDDLEAGPEHTAVKEEARGTVGQQVPAMGLVPTPQPGSFCLQMPIIAVPLLVPMMPPPSTVSASVTTNSPMRTFASPVSAEADETPRSAYTCCIDEEVETPRYHYIPQEEATKGGKAPPSFYEYLDESDEEKVTPQVTSSTDLEMSPTSEEFDSEISTPREHFWRRATVEIEWSVQRTFIHFNTCDTPARRRSKSIG